MCTACWFCNSPTCEGCIYENSTYQEDEEK